MRDRGGPDGLRSPVVSATRFENPIVAGDHPDPTILKDGDDYYMTFSSFLSCPGVVLWHSRDLVQWVPLGPALHRPLGSVWAMDLIKHQDRYYLYLSVMGPEHSSIYVMHTDDVRGTWSDPLDLHLDGCIDPGHAVGEDGQRYLFVNGIRRVRLAADGLRTDGELETVYEPWRYPVDWVVEMFAPEGPKITRHGRYFYLISAVGGTAGPATSHMVIVARSESIHGPWVDCPRNPLVRTRSASERWWSRGHASLVQGPRGDWWMVYHAYENGFRTLGRQTVLEPIRWTADGWFEARGGDLSRPLRRPLPAAELATFTLSDDFSYDRWGSQWSFFHPGPDDPARVRREGGRLVVAGKGTGPADCSPLTCVYGDRRWQAEVTLECHGALGGLLLFYNERMYCGVAFRDGAMVTYQYGHEHSWMEQTVPPGPRSLRLVCDDQVATFFTRVGDGPWVQHPWQMEVSGMHHNVFGGFTSLKLALMAAGSGTVAFTDFRYRGELALESKRVRFPGRG